MSDRLIQPLGVGLRGEESAAWQRSDLREAREREERARLNPQQDLTPTQRLGQIYENLYQQEQRAKAAERARLIKEKKIVVDPITGIETHYMQGNRY